MTQHSSPVRQGGRLRRAALIGIAAVPLLGLAACGGDDAKDSGSGGDAEPAKEITIAHQAFGESEIAARIYGAALEGEGYTVEYQSFKDRAAIYAAFESGDVDLVPEYAATALEFLNGNAGEASPEIEPTMDKLEAQLADKDLAAGAPSDAVDSNSLVVTKATSTDRGVTKISDLTADLRLGGPQDCPTNAGCIPALKSAYSLDFSSTFVPLDLGGPLTKKALEQGDIDVAVIFSTDASIADKDWVVLADDKGIFNADNIVPVGTKALLDEVLASLDKVSAKLNTANVTKMNKRYDIDKDDAETVAKDFVSAEGL